MSRVSELRDEAKRRRRAAQQKMSRIRITTGAEILGSKFDVITSLEKISRMDSRALARYIARVNLFIDRKNQFVSLAENKPLPRARWQQFVRSQRRVNELGNELSAAMNSQLLPGIPKGVEDVSENTIGMRKAIRAPSMKGEGNKPFRMSDLDSRHIRSVNAVDILIRLAERQSSKGHLKRAIRGYRNRVDKVLDKMSEKQLKKDFHKLSDYQFYAIWDTPGLLEDFFQKYESMMKRSVDTVDSDVLADDFGEVLDWARNLEAPKGSPLK